MSTVKSIPKPAAAPHAATPVGPPALIDPFIKSVNLVFATMVGLQITVGAPKQKANPAPSYDVSGIIGFSGEVVGSVVLSFPTETAARIVEAFAGSVMDPDSPGFADAVGELANMVAGAAKKDLGVTANISVPTVVRGAGHTLARLSDVPCVVLPCKTPVGDFAVEINIRPVAKKS